jgi:NTP pyrophosphatase (non-canonical NTP hydrolase)
MKLEEEVQEFIEAETLSLPNANEELADIILVCLNFAKHYEIDIEQELTNKIKKNETR